MRRVFNKPIRAVGPVDGGLLTKLKQLQAERKRCVRTWQSEVVKVEGRVAGWG